MKFLHLADLHFGKTIHGVSLLENGDQGAWVDRFLALTDEVSPDAVVIAGDVYDRGAPSGEAVALLSRMLTALAERHIPALLTAGNHDSAQRLSFAAPLLDREGVHISRPLEQGKQLAHVTLTDRHGPVTFWLMPYVFPALIARALGEDTPRDYDSAVRALLAAQEDIDFTQRNVLIAHQNVTANGAEGLRGGSETMVGGVGQIDYSAFDGFTYVALGHIHAAYPVGRETVRYAGSPLCYHFDETRQAKKGPVLVELGAPGEPAQIQTLTIPPLHPMRELRGDYDSLRQTLNEDRRAGEYLRIVLTDQRVTPESAQYLRNLCERRESVLMELCSEYQAFAGTAENLSAGALEQRSAEELFCDFYTQRAGGVPPTEADGALLARAGELLRAAAGRIPEERDVQALLDFILDQEVEA